MTHQELLDYTKQLRNQSLDMMVALHKASKQGTMIEAKRELRNAGNILSKLNYSLLAVVKEHEMDAINMVDGIEYIDVEEDN